MSPDDAVRLRHMLDACRDVEQFSHGRSRADLDQDRMLLLALVKSIELIGEAASRVSATTQDEVAFIPWRNIVAMRNRLIHGYYDIDLDVVWRTVSVEIPSLSNDVARALKADPAN